MNRCRKTLGLLAIAMAVAVGAGWCLRGVVSKQQNASSPPEELAQVFPLMDSAYPLPIDIEKVGEYPASAGAGGGYVWDEVLEYRVWMHPERGAPDEHGGNDYYYAFATYEEAAEFARGADGSEEPLALILQREYLDEPEPGVYEHITEARHAEWPPEFLSRPRRTPETIPNFLADDAPPNRLDILRGLAQ